MKKGCLDPRPWKLPLLGSQDYVVEAGSWPEHQEEKGGGTSHLLPPISPLLQPRYLLALSLYPYFLFQLLTLLTVSSGVSCSEDQLTPSFLSIPLCWLCALQLNKQGQQHFLVQLLSSAHGKTFTDI